jgi:hypothetical protein
VSSAGGRDFYFPICIGLILVSPPHLANPDLFPFYECIRRFGIMQDGKIFCLGLFGNHPLFTCNFF